MRGARRTRNGRAPGARAPVIGSGLASASLEEQRRCHHCPLPCDRALRFPPEHAAEWLLLICAGARVSRGVIRLCLWGGWAVRPRPNLVAGCERQRQRPVTRRAGACGPSAKRLTGAVLALWAGSVRAGARAYLGPRPAMRRAGDMMVAGVIPQEDAVRPLDLSRPSTRGVSAAAVGEPGAGASV